MTTSINTVRVICQNCFKQIDKMKIGSNFCCQECFDEWMGKQMAHAIAQVSYGVGLLVRK